MKKLKTIIIFTFLISLSICALASMQAKAQATPTLTSTAPSGAVAGVSFVDSALLTGATSDAGGTVTYTLSSGTYPTGSVVGTPDMETVSGGVVPDSVPFTVTMAGSYYFIAVYSGDSNNNGVTASVEAFTVGLASPTLISTAPSGAVAGTGFTDSSVLAGTSGSNAGGTVTYTLYSGTPGSGTQVGSSSFVTVSGGVVPDSVPFTVTMAGSYYFIAVYSGDSNNNGASSSAKTFTVGAAGAVSFVVSGFPSPTVAGVAHTVTVTAKDMYGNTATGYAGTVKITSSDGAAVLPANAVLTSGIGSFTVTLETAVSQSIFATDTVTGSITGSQTGITVNPGVATRLVVSSGTSQVAGTPFTVTVTAKDAYENTATGYTGTVHFTSSDSGVGVTLPSNYTFQAEDLGTHTFTNGVTLMSAGSQSVTATDTVTGSITGSQTGITVNPGVATRLVVSSGTSQVAGTPFTVTVTAKDAYENTATGYTGTVHFTSSDSGVGVTLPSNYTFQAEDLGTHTFTNGVTLMSAGSQSVTATDTVTGSITGSQTGITVGAAGAVSFVVSGFPSPTVAGVAHTVTVTAKDMYGNTATGYAGTVKITSSDGAAVLPANAVLTSGIGFFTVTLKTAGTESITATDAGNRLITGSQTGITVNVASGIYFVVSGFPSSSVAGVAHSVTVIAYDMYGNLDTGYTGTVAVTSSDGAGVLPANAVLTSGIGSFTVILKTAGTQVITAIDTVTSSITGLQNGITVTAAGLDHIVINPAFPSIVAGNSQVFTVQAFDQYGNSLGDVTSSAAFTAPGASVTGNSVYATAVGPYTVTVTYNGKSDSTKLMVNAGALDHFVFNTVATQTAGSAFSITVTAEDAYGNPVISYSGKPTLSVSTGIISPTVTGAFSSGVWTGVVTVTSAGSGITIMATDGTHNGSSNTFTVNSSSTPTPNPNPTPIPTSTPMPSPTPTAIATPAPTPTPASGVTPTPTTTQLPTASSGLILVTITTAVEIIVVSAIIAVTHLRRKHRLSELSKALFKPTSA